MPAQSNIDLYMPAALNIYIVLMTVFTIFYYRDYTEKTDQGYNNNKYTPVNISVTGTLLSDVKLPVAVVLIDSR